MMGLPETDWLLREQPAFDLNVRLSDVPAAQLDEWVLEAAARAAARGVVGISDFEFDDAPGAWVRRFAAGFRGLRVRALVYPPHLDAAVAAGIRTGQPVLGMADDTGGLLTGGPFKLFTDGSLNTRTAWCDDPYPGLEGAEASGIPTYEPADLLELARVGVPARPGADDPRDRRPGDGARPRHVRGARDPARGTGTSRSRSRQHPARPARARRGPAALRAARRARERAAGAGDGRSRRRRPLLGGSHRAGVPLPGAARRRCGARVRQRRARRPARSRGSPSRRR